MPQISDTSSYAGTLVSEVPEPPEVISDGKRMRMVWKAGDGNGDPSAHIVERSMNLVRGHPTWKIFIEDVPLPIVRGSSDEPPRFCYLDDRACYAIYCAKEYSDAELREFWPWDFNHQGNIKRGRMNRGNPAFLDDSCTEFGRGCLRGKDQWYTFSGAPEVIDYKPLRPKKETRMEKLITKEYAGEAIPTKCSPKDFFEQNEDISRSLTLSPTNSKLPVPKTPSNDDCEDHYPSRPDITSQEAANHSGTPIFTSTIEAAQSIITKPSYLGVFNPKLALATKPETSSSQQVQPTEGSPLKRRFVTPPAEYGITKKRIQKPPHSLRDHLGGDSAQDEDSVENLEDTLKAEVSQLKSDLRAVRIEVKKVKAERDHYRTVIVMLLANKFAQHIDLTERITAFQRFSNALDSFKDNARYLANSAKKEIAPTTAFSEGLDTVLDEPGKYMYQEGMDEDWKVLQEEARKMNEANGRSGSKEKGWLFA